jgi:uncharacterized membrane protein YjjP (DUF1212 family)
MWNKFQSVMVVFFAVVIVIESCRLITGPFAVKPHAFIDGMISVYLLLQIVQKNGKAIATTSTVTASAVLLAFVAWATLLR